MKETGPKPSPPPAPPPRKLANRHPVTEPPDEDLARLAERMHEAGDVRPIPAAPPVVAPSPLRQVEHPSTGRVHRAIGSSTACGLSIEPVNGWREIPDDELVDVAKVCGKCLYDLDEMVHAPAAKIEERQAVTPLLSKEELDAHLRSRIVELEALAAGRPPRPLPVPEIAAFVVPVDVGTVVLQHLHRLLRTGLFGASIERVAEILLLEGLRQHAGLLGVPASPIKE